MPKNAWGDEIATQEDPRTWGDQPAAQRDLPADVTPSAAGGGRGSVQPRAVQPPDQVVVDRGPADDSDPLTRVTPSAPRAQPTFTVDRNRTGSVMEDRTVPEAPFNPAEGERLSLRRNAEAAPAETRVSLGSRTPTASRTMADRGAMLSDASLPVRAAARAAVGATQGAAGLLRAGAEAVGADRVAEFAGNTASAAGDFETGMGNNKPVEGFGPKSPVPYLRDMGEGAAASLMNTATIATTFGAKAIYPLMYLQSWGKQYDDARNAGQEPGVAFANATPYAAFEVLGEKFQGLGKAAGAVGTLLSKGASTSAKRTAADIIVRAGVREVPGELITYLGQTGVDLLPGIGIRQDLTMGQFLDGLRDTVVQSAMMSTAIGGTGAAAGRNAGAPPPDAEALARAKGFLTTEDPRVARLKAAGEKEAAGMLERQLNAAAVDNELPALGGRPFAVDPGFQVRYRNLRTEGVKPVEAASRAAMLSGFEQIGGQAGLTDKAVASATEAAQKLPMDKVPGFLDKFTAALIRRGMGTPLPDGTVAGAVGALRDDAMKSVTETFYADTPDDIAAAINQLEQKQSPAKIESAEAGVGAGGNSTAALPPVTVPASAFDPGDDIAMTPEARAAAAPAQPAAPVPAPAADPAAAQLQPATGDPAVEAGTAGQPDAALNDQNQPTQEDRKAQAPAVYVLKPNGDGQYMVVARGPDGKKFGQMGLTVKEVGGKKYLSIDDVNVLEEYRGKGIGTGLYDHAIGNLPEGIDGVLSESKWVKNNTQVPRVHAKLREKFAAADVDGGTAFAPKTPAPARGDATGAPAKPAAAGPAAVEADGVGKFDSLEDALTKERDGTTSEIESGWMDGKGRRQQTAIERAVYDAVTAAVLDADAAAGIVETALKEGRADLALYAAQRAARAAESMSTTPGVSKSSPKYEAIKNDLVKRKQKAQADAQTLIEKAAKGAAPATAPKTGDTITADGKPAAKVRYGRNGTPLDEGGKPFKTKLDATRYKNKYQPQTRVVKAGDGFALIDFTDKELAAQAENGKRRQAAARIASWEKNPLMAFLGRYGLRLYLASEYAPGITERRKAMIPGYGPIFRQAGMSIDMLAEIAEQDGFLPPGSRDSDMLADLIGRAFKGERIAPMYAEGAVEQEFARQAPTEEFEPEEMDAIADLSELRENELDAIEDLVDDVPDLTAQSNTSTEDAMRAIGFSEQEIINAKNRQATQESAGPPADGEGRGQPAEADPEEAPRADRGREGPTGREGVDAGAARPDGEGDAGRNDPPAPAAGPATARAAGRGEPASENRGRPSGGDRPAATPENPNPSRNADQVAQTPAPAGVSASGLTWELRSSGTLAVKGDTAVIKAKLASLPAKTLMVMQGGIMVGKTQVQKALDILQDKPAPAPTAKPLSMGTTPGNAEPVTVKNGTVYVGKYEAMDFDSGEPITVPAGATDEQVKKALKDGGAIGKRQKFFGGTQEAAAAPVPAIEPPPTDRYAAGKALTKDQRKQVLSTLVDVYKAKDAPREQKGIGPSGNERYGYVHSPDLFEKSDITGAMVRYYVTLPDGRIAHPSELFPDFTQAQIDTALIEQANEERREKDGQAHAERQADTGARASPAEADAAFMQRNRGFELRDWRTGKTRSFVHFEKDGRYYSVLNDDTAMMRRIEKAGWTRTDALTAPTQQEVLDQQQRRENADELDQRQQIDREAERQTLTAQTAPEQRRDNTGDMFGGPSVEDFQKSVERSRKPGTAPEGPDLFASEPTTDYTGAYETDLFGEPLPAPRGNDRAARPAGAGVRGDAQPASTLQDTPAPRAEYYVNTFVGSPFSREIGASRVTTPEQAAQATRYLYRSAVERFDGIVTDKDGKPLAIVGGFKGAVSQASVYPATVMGEAVRIPGAAHIWFSHNHPSGTANLSTADERLNMALSDVFKGSGIEPMGLLAIAGDRFAYVDQYGSPSSAKTIPEATTKKSIPVIERELGDGTPQDAITTPGIAKQVAAVFYKKASEPGVMLLNSQNAVAGWFPITPAMMGPLRGTGGLNAIYRAVSQSNAASAIIVHGGELDYAGIGDYSAKVTPSENIAAALAKIDVRPLDSVNVVTNKSVAEQGREVAKGPLFSRGRISEADRAENLKRWSNNAPYVSSEAADTYDFKSGQKVMVEAYHGTARPDRVGTVFQRKRATSGPMAFFTSAPELASSYAQGKADTSITDDERDFPQWFKYKAAGQRSAVDIVRAWNFLPEETKARIAALAPRIKTDNETGEQIELGPEGTTNGIGNYEWELQQTQRSYDRRGNPLKAMLEGWLNGGVLYNEEERFLRVLELAGFPVKDVTYDAPNATYPFVYKTYIAMQKPLVTGDVPQAVINALKEAAKRDRSRAQIGGADMWDKNTRTLREWVANYTDPANDSASYVWTSIPDKVTDVLKSMGYDGIIDWSGKGGGDRHPVYIPFEETQVKSAIGNKGTFDPLKKDILFARAWRSDLRDKLAEAKLESSKEEGWRMFIQGLTSKGVKPDEIEWSGVTDWLKLQTGKVTKQQVLDYLDANGVQVQEVVLGGSKPEQEDMLTADDIRVEPEGDQGRWFIEAPTGSVTARAGTEEEAIAFGVRYFNSQIAERNRNAARDADNTKYSQYTLPGGTNYREVLLTLPEKKNAPIGGGKSAATMLFERDMMEKYAGETFPSVYGKLNGNEIDKYEMLVREDRNSAKSESMAQDRRNNYKSSHWDQPNVLAHIRLNDRTDADGKRVLFVEEIQSDWAQKGRKEGFQGDLIPQNTTWEAVDTLDEFDTRQQAEAWANANPPPDPGENMEARLVVLERERFGTGAGLPSRWVVIEEQRSAVAQAPQLGGPPPAPFVTKTEAWTALAIKRIVKLAADEGYDRVAFVNGEQSAERYDLSKQVRSIAWTGRGNDTEKSVTITPNSGNDIEFRVMPDGTTTSSSGGFAGNEFAGKRLDEIVGKDVAERIMGAPYGDMRGDGLKVGGEGMKAFYDTIVPNSLKTVLKKVGGGGLETVAVVAPDNKVRRRYMAGFDAATKTWGVKDTTTGEFVEKSENEEAAQDRAKQLSSTEGRLEQPGFTITPEMREKASQGLPLFGKAQTQTPGLTPAQFTAELAQAFGPKVADRLQAKGVVVPLADQTKLPAHVVPFLRDGDIVFGFYDPRTNRTYAVLENLTPDMVKGLAMHEVGVHYGFEAMLGADKYKQVMKQLDLMRKSGNVAVQAAYDQAQANAARPSQIPEETLAYLVQEAPNNSVIKDVIARIKAWLFREFGIGGKYLTERDLHMLARAAVQHAARTEPGGVEVPAFMRQNEGMANRKDVVGNQGGRSADDEGKGAPTPDTALKQGRPDAGMQERPTVRAVSGSLGEPAQSGGGAGSGVNRSTIAEAEQAAIKAANAEMETVNQRAIDEEMRSIQINGNGADIEEIANNPKFWNAEDEELTPEGYAEYERQNLELAKERAGVGLIEDLSDLNGKDQTAQAEAFAAYADALGLSVRKSYSSGGSRYVEVGIGDADYKFRFADHFTTVRDTTMQPDFNVAPGRNDFTEAFDYLLSKLNESPAPTNDGAPEFSRAPATDTKAFKDWFGDSKVVDADGKPLVVYHGTRADIQAFAGDKVKARFPNSEGFYFTSSPRHASVYADSINNAAEDFNPASRFVKPVAEGANVMPSYVSLQNPKVLMVSEWGTLESRVDSDGGATVRAARAAGHDGVIVRRRAGDEYDGDLVIAFKPEQIKSATGNSGNFDPNDPDIRRSFAGQQAATADTMALATAQQRLEAGEDAETVRQETGWHKGVDGKWRFEINDAGAQLAQQVYFAERGKWYPSRFLADARDHGSDTGGTGTLGDVLEHPALFAAYPALRDMPVTAKIRKDQESGAFDGRFITATAENEGRLLSVLLHEIQHGIQHIEGFAMGGTPQSVASILEKERFETMANKDDALTAEFDALKLQYAGVPESEIPQEVANRVRQLRSEINAIRNTGWREASNPFARRQPTPEELFAGYRRLAGEVEARNTQARQGMTDAQRRATPPNQTADVADADVIVVFNGKEMANAPMPANAAPDAPATAQPLRTPAATIRAAINRAYGKLLGQLESKGLVTLTQTQEQAIEAAAQARADKTGQPLAEVRASLMGSVSNSVATDTPAFKRWFGDSKVVDAEGKPLVVYHGSPSATFTTFDVGAVGAFFSDRFDVAASYAGRYNDVEFDEEGAYVDDEEDQGVYSAYLSAKNPMVVDWRGKDWGVGPEGLKLDDWAARAKRAGYDSLVVENVVDTGWLAPGLVEDDGLGRVFVVFRPEQIKSATGNNGDFDPNDLDIRRSANGAIQGFFDPQTGQSFLIADNLTAEAAPGVLMHEVGIHMAADGSMKALFNRAAMMLKLQRGNPFIKAVQARMDAAGETSGEEAAAYIAEAYENDRANAPASVQRWLADLLAAVKAWMFKKGIMGADRLTVADIAAVARANARSMARDGGATGGQGFGTAFSRNIGDAMPHPFTGFTREKFLGKPKITPDSNAKDLIPSGGKSIDDKPAVPFSNKWYPNLVARYSENGAAVYDGEKVIASYYFGDTLVVDKKYRRAGIGSELVYQWRMRNPNSKTAATRTKKSQALQEKVWDRVQRELYQQEYGPAFSHAPAGDQTQTEAFKRWFKDSKVVDADGKPLVVYHGTASDITAFDMNMSGESTGNTGFYGAGAYFSEDADYASGFSFWAKRSEDHAPNVVPVYLSLKNPAYINITPKQQASIEKSKATAAKLISTLIDRGTGQAVVEKLRGFVSENKFEPFMGTIYNALGGGEGTTALLKEAGFDGVTIYGGISGKEKLAEAVAFHPEQIKSAIGNNGEFDPNNPDIRFSRTQNLFEPDGWSAPEPTRTDRAIYELQNGRIDLKRVQQAITAARGAIDQKFDAQLAETLYPGRVARRTDLFLDREVKPLLTAMAKSKATMDELADYLIARHAPERNAQVAKVNPDLPDGGAGRNSKGELMTNDAAAAYMAGIPKERRAELAALAEKVDAITAGTRGLLVAEGLEKADTVAAWQGAYKNYVPLFKDEAEHPHPQGTGFNVRGPASKRSTGSTKQVTNVIAHVLMQREAAITRAEKNRVGLALYGLALSNPNREFWTTIKPGMTDEAIGRELQDMGVDPTVAEAGMDKVPTIRTVDPLTQKVVDRPNPIYKSMPGAITLKVNGEDRVLLINTKTVRGLRMAEALKNLDGMTNFNLAGMMVGKVTRWMAAISTQYNPAFGLVNLVRDTLGGAVNIGSTKLRGKGLKVLADVPMAMQGIARELAGGGETSEWSRLWKQFQDDGGRTGYREVFAQAQDRADAIERELKAAQDAGKLTAGKVGHAALDLLDGFNTTLENAVRLAAYKHALDIGMSRAEAARLGRELTVDFNRKGRLGRELGPLYAFFNASVQGGARTLETLRGPTGAKVIAGGLALGAMQAMMLLAAGYDDDEIPEFVKTRALIIPLFGEEKKFIAIPYPLGLHVIPNTGRVMTELSLNGGKNADRRAFNAVGEIAAAFNPLGGGNIFTADGFLKTVAPTIVDPVIEWTSNKNFMGTPIERESRGETDNRPGYQRAKEATLRSTTGQAYLGISKAINWATGGTAYEKGLASPTPEMVRYIAQTAGGGVLRELEKTVDSSVKAMTGEKVKKSGIPIVGRFYGEVDDDQVQASRYYEKAKDLDRLQSSLKAAQTAGDGAAMTRIIEDNPELALARSFDQVQRQLAKLNKAAVSTVDDRETVETIDQARVEAMRGLNDAVKAMEQAEGKLTPGQRLKAAMGR